MQSQHPHTHGRLMTQISASKYDISGRGVCYAYAIKAKDACFANDRATFTQRGAWLMKTDDVAAASQTITDKYLAEFLPAKKALEAELQFESRKKSYMNANDQVALKQLIDAWEYKLDEIRKHIFQTFTLADKMAYTVKPFFQEVTITQEYADYAWLFPYGQYFHLKPLEHVLNLLEPTDKHTQRVPTVIADSFSYPYTVAELCSNLVDLENVINLNLSVQFVFIITSLDHALTIEYINQQWVMYEVDHMPCVVKTNTYEFAQLLIAAMYCQQSCVLNFQVHTKKSDEDKAKQILVDLKQQKAWKKRHKVTLTNATRYDDRDGSWLLQAIINNDIALATQLLMHASGFNLPHRPSKKTPLYAALLQSNLFVAKQLVEYGADVNAPNRNGITPLHLACSTGQLDLLKLMGANADFSTTCTIARSTLQFYIDERKRDAEMKELLSVNPFDNDDDQSLTELRGINPIHLTAIYGKTATLQWLLNKNVPLLESENKFTALQFAQAMNHTDIVNILKPLQETLNNNQLRLAQTVPMILRKRLLHAFAPLLATPTWIKNFDRHFEILRRFAQMWAAETEFHDDMLPLNQNTLAQLWVRHLTQTRRPIDTFNMNAEFLLLTRAEFVAALTSLAQSAKNSFQCKSLNFTLRFNRNSLAIHYDIENETWILFDPLQLDIQTLAPCELVDKIMRTFAFNQVTCININIDPIQSMHEDDFAQLEQWFNAECRLDINRMHAGITITTLAIIHKDYASATLLLAQNADPNLRARLHPLEVAYANRHLEMFETLLTHGANPNIRREKNLLLIDLIKANEIKFISRLLVDSTRIDVNFANTDGLTPLDIAVLERKKEIVALLTTHGAKHSKEFNKKTRINRQAYTDVGLFRDKPDLVINMSPSAALQPHIP